MRYPLITDAPALREHINALSSEKTYIAFQGEQISLDEELVYLKGMLQNIENNKAIMLLAFSDDELIGVSDITMKPKVEAHVGSFGIHINRNYRRGGIGSKLIELMLNEAEDNLPGLRIVELSLFGDNLAAYKMYKDKFGFREFGRLSAGINHNNRFVDRVHMYKALGKSWNAR